MPRETDTGAQYVTLVDANGNSVSGASTSPNYTASAQPAVVSGSLTASGQSVQATCTGYSSALIAVFGVYGAFGLTIEGSLDSGTNWFPLQAQQMGSVPNLATSAVIPGANSNTPYWVPTNGCTTVRARSTSWASGTCSVQIGLSGIAGTPPPNIVELWNGASQVNGPSADAMSYFQALAVSGLLYNGASFDRPRGIGGYQQTAPSSGTLTDRSGTITTGATAQQLAAVNASRKYLIIQNPSTAAGQGIATAESLWINFTTTAVAAHPSIELVAGGSLVMESSFVSTELVSVVAATTAHAWTAKEA